MCEKVAYVLSNNKFLPRAGRENNVDKNPQHKTAEQKFEQEAQSHCGFFSSSWQENDRLNKQQLFLKKNPIFERKKLSMEILVGEIQPI